MSPFSPLAGRVEVQAAARRESSGRAVACPNLSYWIWTQQDGFQGELQHDGPWDLCGSQEARVGEVVGPEKRRELTRGGIVGRANSIL